MLNTATKRQIMLLTVVMLVMAACARTNTLEVTRAESVSREVAAAGTIDGEAAAPGAGSDSGAVAGGATQNAGGAVGGTDPGAGTRPAGSSELAVSTDEVAVEGDTIKIGVMSTLSGGNKFVGEPPYRVALAYAERVNKAGGINGRKLEILGYDVCLNCPDEGLAQAKKAVEKDGVFALANTFVINASLGPVIPYLNEKKVPMIQGSSGEQSRTPALSPYNFSVGFTVPGRAALMADFVNAYLEENNLPKKVALLYFTDALGEFVSDNQRAALERLDIEIVDEEPVAYDATMTNQNSQVVKMQLAGTELVVGAHGVLCAFSMQAAEQNGWDVPYACTIAYDAYMATYAGAKALSNRDVFADTEGYATPDMTTPGMLDYLSLLEEYYPEGDHGLVTLYSYMGMKLLEDGIRSMGDNVTQAGLARFMEGLTAYDADGLTAPFTLSPDDHGSIHGAHIVRINPDGTFERLTDDWSYPSPIHGLPGPVA